MALHRVSELREFLEQHSISPRKSLSQNFLVDRNIIEKLIQQVKAGDQVLEIGSGPGAITEILRERGAEVFPIEKDERFVASTGAILGDILDYDLDTLPGSLKVISNLPYQISSPILTRLVPRRDKFDQITVLVQEEVARRYTAKPESKLYGSITVFLQFYADVTWISKVKRNAFWPVPNVDSAIIDIVPKEPPPVDAKQFFSMVRTAFNQRRKMLRSTIGVDSNARPETLSLGDWLTTFEEYTHQQEK